MDLEERARHILSASDYINVATATVTGVPWNTPVTGKSDDALNFYWASWKEAQHSKNIRANPRVFITLYDSTRQRGDNHRRCIYIKGEAEEIEDIATIRKAISLLYKDRGEEEVRSFTGDAQRRIYKASPVNLWLNDVSERQVTNETIKMRIEVSLEKLKAML